MTYRYKLGDNDPDLGWSKDSTNLWNNFVWSNGYDSEIAGCSWYGYMVWLDIKLLPYHGKIFGSISGIDFDTEEDATAFVLKFKTGVERYV